jgi:hypothetical protein
MNPPPRSLGADALPASKLGAGFHDKQFTCPLLHTFNK